MLQQHVRLSEEMRILTQSVFAISVSTQWPILSNSMWKVADLLQELMSLPGRLRMETTAHTTSTPGLESVGRWADLPHTLMEGLYQSNGDKIQIGENTHLCINRREINENPCTMFDSMFCWILLNLTNCFHNIPLGIVSTRISTSIPSYQQSYLLLARPS